MKNTVNVIDDLSLSTTSENSQDYIKDGLLHCHLCNTPKEYRAKFGPDYKKVCCLCDCETKIRNQEQKKQELKKQKCYIERLTVQGIQDKALRSASFEKADGSNQKNMQRAQSYVQKFREDFYPQGSGLLFWGDTGRGKTYTAACIANALIDKGIPVLKTDFSTISNQLYAAQDKNATLASFNRYDLLVIDDLGVERKSDYMLENMFIIIDQCYKNNKPMIITTNITLQMLGNPTSIVQSRLYDRILEKCIPLFFDGPNRRDEKRTRNFEHAKKVFGAEESE
ncbi:ATP-binding protein [Eubacteriaceae bacterium ES2]|nr:ATP-binding protein [Eubacteriaceae bacterium ES2]